MRKGEGRRLKLSRLYAQRLEMFVVKTSASRSNISNNQNPTIVVLAGARKGEELLKPAAKEERAGQ